MLLLRKLKINNFLSYKEAEIDFAEDAQISIEGPSGSGKSSIVDAIIWVLFGKGRSENRNLIRSGEKICAVDLDLVDGKDAYKIIRTVTSAGKQTLMIETPEGPLQRTGLKDHQDWIEKEFLHSSYTLFINSIAYPQENVDSFVKQTASKRKDLLLEIANVADYDLYYNRAREKATLLASSIIRDKALEENAINARLRALPIADGLEVVLDKKASVTAQILAKSEILKKHAQDALLYKGYLASKNGFETNLSDRIKTIENCKKWIIQREESIKDLKSVNIDQIDENLKELDKLKKELTSLEEIEKYNSERQIKLNSLLLDKPIQWDFKKALNDLNKELIDILNGEDTPCPDGKHCQCFKSGFENRRAIKESQIAVTMGDQLKNENSLKEWNEKIKELGEPKGDGKTYASILELKDRIKKLAVFENVKNSYEFGLSTIKTTEGEIAQLKTDLSYAGGERMVIEKQIAKVTKQIEDFHLEDRKKEVSVVEKMLDDLKQLDSVLSRQQVEAEMARDIVERGENDMKELRFKIGADEEALESVNYVKEAFSNTGIKTIIIDYLIPRLEDKINEILGQLSTFRISLETQKASADGETQIEGLFINIFNTEGEEFSFENYSGGEKLKISVAISEALASLSKVGWRIMDEMWVGLDEASTDNFSAVIESLQSKFSQILCISHLRIIQDRFSDKLFISKQNGSSVIDK